MSKFLHSFGKFPRINILNKLPLFPFWDFSNCRLFLLIVSHGSYILSSPSVHSFTAFVFFWMDSFQWPVIDFSRSFSSTRSNLFLLPRAFFTLFPVVSKLQNFCLLIFCNFYLSGKFFILYVYQFLDFGLSVLSCSTLSILKTTILNYLSGKSQISISLGLCFFGGVIFPCFPMLPESGIAVFVLQSLLTGFRRLTPSISFAQDSEISQSFLWISLLHTSCFLLEGILRIVFFGLSRWHSGKEPAC